MVITTINIENDVRRRYNRRVFFCIRIKGASLLIGLWDLFIHSLALCVLIFMFGRTPEIYHDSNEIVQTNLSNPTMEINAKNFYSHMNLATIKWIYSLNQQDKCIVFFIVLSATVIILAHISGVLSNKPSYLVPYFLIKVFNVIIAIVSMLGFYAYLPDITVWLRMQPNFPFKTYLLELDIQTLQLVIFTILLFIILAKVYMAAIIWYCYGYITALNMARSIGIITAHSDIQRPVLGEMYSPPKYEEAIRLNCQQEEDDAPPPYTPLLSS